MAGGQSRAASEARAADALALMIPSSKPASRPWRATSSSAWTCARSSRTTGSPPSCRRRMPLVEQLLLDKSNLSGPAPGQRPAADPEYVDRARRGAQEAGPAGASSRRDRPLGAAEAGLSATSTSSAPSGRTCTTSTPTTAGSTSISSSIATPRQEVLEQVPDRRGRPVGLDGRRDGPVRRSWRRSSRACRRVVVHLIAFDTNVIDLTPWVADPFEVADAHQPGRRQRRPEGDGRGVSKIVDPGARRWSGSPTSTSSRTTRPLFEMIKAVKQSGVHFIPVGSVSGKGYFSVNEWFRTQLKEHRPAGADRQHQEADRRAEEATQLGSPRRGAKNIEAKMTRRPCRDRGQRTAAAESESCAQPAEVKYADELA